MNKIEEFWIVDSKMINCPDGKSRLCRTEDPAIDGVNTDKFIHVIEYSAYEKLKKDHDIMKEFLLWYAKHEVLNVENGRAMATLKKLGLLYKETE